MQILDAHHLSSMAARTCRVLSACGIKLPGGFCRIGPPSTASFRLVAAVPCAVPRYSVRGFAPCRAAAREQGNGNESLASNDFVRDNVGGIHVITGPMFAGKTTALLKRIRQEADAGRY